MSNNDISAYGGIDPKDGGQLISVSTSDLVQGRIIEAKIVKLLPREFEQLSGKDRRQPAKVAVNEIVEFSATYSMYHAKRIEAELLKIFDAHQLIRVSSIRALMKSAIQATVNERTYLDEDNGSRHPVPGLRQVPRKESGDSRERRGG